MHGSAGAPPRQKPFGLLSSHPRADSARRAVVDGSHARRTAKNPVAEADPRGRTAKVRVAEADPRGRMAKVRVAEANPRGRMAKVRVVEVNPSGQMAQFALVEAVLRARMPGIPVVDADPLARVAYTAAVPRVAPGAHTPGWRVPPLRGFVFQPSARLEPGLPRQTLTAGSLAATATATRTTACGVDEIGFRAQRVTRRSGKNPHLHPLPRKCGRGDCLALLRG